MRYDGLFSLGESRMIKIIVIKMARRHIADQKNQLISFILEPGVPE